MKAEDSVQCGTLSHWDKGHCMGSIGFPKSQWTVVGKTGHHCLTCTEHEILMTGNKTPKINFWVPLYSISGGYIIQRAEYMPG